MQTLAFLENLGFGEWLVIIIVTMLILGPSAARRAGRFVGHATTGGFPKQPDPAPASSVPISPLDELYRTLDLTPDANMEQVRSAYKELAKVWHPDRFGQDAKLRERATQKLQQINAAYEKICQMREPRSQN